MANKRIFRWQRHASLLTCLLLLKFQDCFANQPPYFTADLNNHVISENTPVGTQVYQLKAVDPEKSPLKFGIMGTDKLSVDEKTGIISIAKPIDREVSDRLKVTVTVEDIVDNEKNENNIVTIPVSVTISDENDNSPTFMNPTEFEALELIEDTPPGTRIHSIEVRDPDLTGMALSVNCTASIQTPEACNMFPIDVKEATAGILKGEMRLAAPLDYNRRSLYQFVLTASDGERISRQAVLIRIKDVQNTPPIFNGAMSGRVMEDSPIGTLVMIIQARDGDLGKPRDVKLTLLSNPGDSFHLDSKSGHLTTAKPLDRETLGSLLTIEIKAQEVPNSDETVIATQADIDILQTIANMTILIDDVNDFIPKFNKKEFATEIDENTIPGTPLSNLDMVVTDEDTGTFADFTLTIDGPLAELFDIQPRFASGSVRPVAKNTDEPELFSTATVSVSITDINDNRPQFEKEVYILQIAEDAPPGTKVGKIMAFDPDSKEFGNEGLVYTLVGAGSKKFTVSRRSGEIFVAECNSTNSDNIEDTDGPQNCLDYETQKTYDLLYMASDSYKQEGFVHSVVPLQIEVLDANDNPVYFDEPFARRIPEDARQFEPRFYIKAKDIDKSSEIAYRLLDPVPTHFKIDETTAELLIRTSELTPGNFTFRVEANDGIYKAATTVNVNVTDTNNHFPVFTEKTLANRIVIIPEDAEVGAVVLRVEANDADLEDNGIVRYSIDKGSYGVFDINENTGEISLVKDLDNEVVSNYELLVTAFDAGSPPMRTSTTIRINVGDVYTPLPKIWPVKQRAQVSESADIGDIVTQITTNAEELGLTRNPAILQDLKFQWEPVDARNVDNKPVTNFTLFKDWFKLTADGRVVVQTHLDREIITAVNYSVSVTSEKAKPGSKHFGTLMLTIFEVNDLPPRVEDMEIETYEELPPGMSILTMEAEDPEGGQISNYFIKEGSEYFSIDNKTGEIKVAGRLDYEDRPVYNLTVVAVDSGVPQLSSTSQIMVSLININDNDPLFSLKEYPAEIYENSPEGTIVTSVAATDADGDIVNYEIESNEYSPAFRIDRLGQISVTKEGLHLLDREKLASPFITISVKAKDPQRVGYATVRIKIADLNDIWPRFEKKSYMQKVHAPLRTKQEIIKVTAHGGDLPDSELMHYRILSGNDGDVFEIDSISGVIRAAGAFEKAGEFRLVVEITDNVDKTATDHYDRTGVLIQILPGNFRKPEFLFPNKINSTLIAKESDMNETEHFGSTLGYTKVLGQVLAFDPDEGNAGKIQFYFKEGDNLVTETEHFRLETETGRIHQISPLDREQMNKYNLLIVAKDNGVPVSTQSQQILTIEVADIDDHKPRFEKRSYNFTIKENSLENTFIGQVQALDEDDPKNAQIFYFLASEEKNRFMNDDIRVDIKTGMIHSNKVLDRERIEKYQFFIRASPSPLRSKSSEIMTASQFHDDQSVTSITIVVLDENDNPPRFPQKMYFAAINSDAEPGREILTFDSVDVDSSSVVQYTMIGANLILDEFKSGGSVIPSPFRVDTNSGRLTISAAAMRQYSGGNNRFLVKVQVKETTPPYYTDSTQVQVWIVETNQETVLTIKTPPRAMLKEQLIDVLSNVTTHLVLITKITPHVDSSGVVNKEWSDVYVTAIDRQSSQIIPVGQFLQSLDLGHDRLKKLENPIELFSAVPAAGSREDGEYFFNGRESFDTAFAGLIALVALLCMGLAAILAVCCCLTRMRSDNEKQNMLGHGMKYPLHPNGSASGTPSIRHGQTGEMIEDMSATDNPLWMDNHKMKTYEEQELTMQVASEMDNSTGSIDDNDDMSPPPHHPQHPHHNQLHHHHHSQMRSSSPERFYSEVLHHPQPSGALYDILGEDTIAVHL